MVEIQDDALRRVLASAFGWNISPQNLLESSSSDSGEGKEITIVDKDLYQRVGRRLVAEEIDSQRNMEDVAERADRLLQSEPLNSGSQGKTDQGWIRECLEGAGKAYDDDLKNYWARLLAGEIRNPGTYSKRIVDFMKKLSVKDAERIQKICSYVLFCNGPKLLQYEKEPYGFQEVRFLMGLGILDSSNDIIIPFGSEGSVSNLHLIRGNIAFRITAKKTKHKLRVYSFTELGSELLNIIGGSQFSVEFLRKYSEKMVRKKPNLSFECGYWVSGVGGFLDIPKERLIFKIPKEE